MSSINLNPVFSNPPYYDDYDPNKLYYRILFNPGVAVQARELTQIQSIIQNQIAQFGNSVYQNGSIVYGSGGSSQKANFLRVYSSYVAPNGITYTVNANDWIGHTIAYVTTDDLEGYKVARGKVVFVDTTTTAQDNYAVIFYQETTSAPVGQDFPDDGGSAEPYNAITITDWTDTINPVPVARIKNASETPTTIPVQDQALLYSIAPGVFFVNGFFCVVESQTIALQQYLPATDPNYGARVYSVDQVSVRVGLNIDWSIVTADSASDLLDPANGTPNSNAPGADRYKIELTLVQYPFTDIDSIPASAITQVDGKQFIELSRFSLGQLTSNASYPVYSNLETTLARRTYDESGSYAVRNFGIDIREHLNNGTNGGVYPPSAPGGLPVGDAAKLAVGLTPGKAYVFGYEFETIGTEYVAIDKARDFANVINHPVSTNYGNYMGCRNLPTASFSGGAAWFAQGVGTVTIGVSTYAGTDLNADTKVSLRNGSGSTIGTANIRALRNRTGISRLWNVYLFNVAMTTGTIGDVRSIENFIVDEFQITMATNYVAGQDFHVGDAITFTTGGSDITAVVVSWYPSSVGTPGSVLTVCQLNGSTVTSTSPAPDLSTAISVNTVTTSPMTYTVSPGSVVATLNDQQDNLGIFNLPYGNAANVMQSLLYNVQMSYGPQTVAGGSVTFVTANSNFTFVPPTSTDVLSTEYILFKNDGNGNRVDLNNSHVTVTATTDYTSVTINFSSYPGISDGDRLVLIATTQISDAGGSSISYYKTKTLTTVTGESSTLTSGVYPLVNVDVFSLDKVFDGSGNDITANFTLDNGQRDDRYIPGSLIPNAGYSGPSTVTVNYKWFARSGVGPYVAQSYSGISYGSIPSYTSPFTGGVYILRNCLDFRPDLNGLSGSCTNVWQPMPSTANLDATYSYYLPRTDKVVLGKERAFRVIRGVPSNDNVVPPDATDAMTLYIIRLNPYTTGPTDLTITPVQNRNYTMRDIGALDARISRLEYYTSLSLLEQQANSLSITDEFGLDRFKAGILVDSFNGHGVGDVLNPDYNCSIDYHGQLLRPPFESTNIGLAIDGTVQTDGSIDYTSFNANDVNFDVTADRILLLKQLAPVTAISQPLASSSISVNPYNVTNFIGTMTLDPSSDTWIDDTTAPAVNVNVGGSNDAWASLSNAFGTQWNDWQTTWTGVQTDATTTNTTSTANAVFGVEQGAISLSTGVTRTTDTTTQNQSRNGIQVSITPDTITQSLGSRVVDLSVIPWIRESLISATAVSMKPNTILYAYFDSTLVQKNCRMVFADQTLQTGSSNSGSTLAVISFPSASTNYVEIGDVVDLRFTQTIGGTPTPLVRYGMTVSAIGSNTLTLTGGAGHLLPESTTGTVNGTVTPVFAYKDSTTSKIWSDGNGNVTVEFSVPAGTFKTGTRLFRLIDDPNNILANSQTNVDCSYFAQGLLQTNETDSITTRIPTATRQTVTDSRIVTSAVTRTDVSVTPLPLHWVDPLAETFLIDANVYPNGLFVHSVDLYFRVAGTSIPVTVQIRPTVNGYPSGSTILGSVTLQPNQVVTSQNPSTTDSTTNTRFQFTTPVYLTPGEYSIVVLSNDSSYQAWIAEMGANQVGTTTTISSQPYTGSFFESQNASTWTAVQTKDLMFRINRCEFKPSTGSTVTLYNKYLPSTDYNLTVVGSYTSGQDFNIGDTIYQLSDNGSTPTIYSSAIVTSWTAPSGGSPGTVGIKLVNKQNIANCKNIPFVASTTTQPTVVSPSLSSPLFSYKITGVADNTPTHTVYSDTAMVQSAVGLPAGTSATFQLGMTEVGNTSITSPAAIVANENANFLTTKKIYLNGASVPSGQRNTVQLNVTMANQGISVNGNVLTPTFDLDRAGLIVAHNLISGESGGSFTLEELPSASADKENARYITRLVKLEPQFESTGIQVILTASIPPGTSIEVYVKAKPVSQSNFDSTPYTLLTPTATITPATNYRELTWVNSSPLDTFDKFAVKVLLYSSNSAVVPTVTDLRAIALV